MQISLISLIQFISVAEHKNFLHSEYVLGITQSCVSTRIKVGRDIGRVVV